MCVCVRIENSAALWHLLLYYLHTNYMKSHRISHGRERTHPNAVSATTPWGRPSPLPLTLFCPISLLLYHMQILVIFFKCCLLLPCIQFLPGALAACLPFHIFQFSTFALLSSLMIPHTFTHLHTHTVWHTHTHMLHTTLVFEALCCLHFHYFFYVIFSFLPFFFFARCPTILTACQKEVVLYSVPRRTPPTPLATNPSMPAPLPLLLLLLPSKCLHSKLPMGQWTVCVCVLLRCAALLPLPAELLPLVFSSPL